MENWAEIRRRVLVDGQSKRSVCREFEHPLGHPPEDPRPLRAAGISPRRSPAQAQARTRSCRSSTRSSRTTRRPPGSSGTPPCGSSSGSATSTATQGGLTIVKEAVAAWRLRSAEVFVPLAHPPGEAQVDFGQAEVTLDGQAATVALFVMTLPYSDAIFVCAFPRECTEAFLEGHVRAFAFFGGVPRRISYDNSKIAVAKIVGSRGPQAHRRVPPAQESSPVRVALLPGPAAQRERYASGRPHS